MCLPSVTSKHLYRNFRRSSVQRVTASFLIRNSDREVWELGVLGTKPSQGPNLSNYACQSGASDPPSTQPSQGNRCPDPWAVVRDALALNCIRQTMPFNQDYAVKILAFLEDIAVPISDSIVDYLSAFFYEIRDFFSHHDRRNIRICTRYAWHE